jgi:hypothetical protein
MKPGVAPHHLDDEHAIVALRRGVQLVERLDHGAHRGVEAERVDRARDVVVDRLRHAHHVHPAPDELLGDLERAVAADRDDRVDAERARVGHQLVGAVDVDVAAVGLAHRVVERAAAVGRAEDGAAQVGDAAHRLGGERDDLVLAEEARVAALDAEHVPAARVGGEDGGADDGVQPGGVAAAGGESDAHRMGSARAGGAGPVHPEQLGDLAVVRVAAEPGLLEEGRAVGLDLEAAARRREQVHLHAGKALRSSAANLTARGS